MSGLGPDEWAEGYESGSTPWDLGEAHPELVRRMAELGPPGTALVPGAGRGHDAAALAAAGWAVTAVDFAPVLAGALGEAVGERGHVVIGDALEHMLSRPVDLLFDHTFFCAIPPGRRPAFGRWAAAVVGEGGSVASVVFPVGRPLAEGGPPFAMSVEDLAEALGEAFEVVVDEPAVLPGRASWSTRWAVFRRV